MIRSTLAGVAILLLAACSPRNEATPEPPVAAAAASVVTHGEAATRAQAAAEDLSETLQTALKARMSEGGPEAAIDFCHAEAPAIAAAVGEAHGLRVGRVPVPGRVRNPVNRAQGWQAEAVRELQARAGTGLPVAELAFRQSDGLPAGVALRTMKAIEIVPACLACHGENIAEPVRSALVRHYPDDAATGFKPGDLRGGLWVEVPAP